MSLWLGRITQNFVLTVIRGRLLYEAKKKKSYLHQSNNKGANRVEKGRGREEGGKRERQQSPLIPR